MPAFLSYILDEKTPTYGNRNRFEVTKKSAISDGDSANDSKMATTVHIGTHIDMPYHFYEKGQTIIEYDADFWIFRNPAVIEVEPENLIIKDELIRKLEKRKMDIRECDILIVKSGICYQRDEEIFWRENFGFHPDLYEYLKENFPKLRIFGFDSVSVSSFSDRELGREAHRRFLDPSGPILLLEDMDLRYVDEKTELKRVIVAPMRIAMCDGLPCTVVAE